MFAIRNRKRRATKETEVSAPQWDIFLVNEYVTEFIWQITLWPYHNMCLDDSAYRFLFFFLTHLSPPILFSFVKTPEIRPLHKFQVYNTVLLTIVTTLHIRPPDIFHFIIQGSCPLTIITYFPTPSPPQSSLYYRFLGVQLFFFFF